MLFLESVEVDKVIFLIQKHLYFVVDMNDPDGKILHHTSEHQIRRADMRERFLNLVSSKKLKQAPCILHMHSKTVADGNFAAIDANSRHLIFENFNTPLCKLDRAIVRVDDIVQMSTNLNLSKS